MSLGDRLGIAGLIVALIGIATVYLWPQKKWIGYAAVALAIVLIVGWGGLEVMDRQGLAPHPPVAATTTGQNASDCAANVNGDGNKVSVNCDDKGKK